MKTLTWMHTRKNTPMSLKGNFSTLWFRVMFVRNAFPNHPMFVNGVPV